MSVIPDSVKWFMAECFYLMGGLFILLFIMMLVHLVLDAIEWILQVVG